MSVNFLNCAFAFVLLANLLATAMPSVDIVKLEQMLSPVTQAKVEELLNLTKSKNWMDSIMRQISATMIKRQQEAKENPHKELEDAIEKVVKELKTEEAEEKQLQSAHRSFGKLNKSLRSSNGRDYDGTDAAKAGVEAVRNRRKRSEPNENHGHGGQAAASLTTSTSTPSQSRSSPPAFTQTPTQTHPSVATTTERQISSAINVVSSLSSRLSDTSTLAHTLGTTLGFRKCPPEFNHCVHGDCIDLGYDIYTCNCWKGFGGYSCEWLELQGAVASLTSVGDVSNPADFAATNPEAYSAATAIALYLTGDIWDFE